MKCCREKGVLDICLGYCLKEMEDTKSRAITGRCAEWLAVIGQCKKGLLVFTSKN